MSSRAPQSSGDRSRDTVLPSFRESFPESVFGHPQVARSAPSAPPFHNGVTSGGHPQRYPQPSLPPARTPPSNLRPTSPQLHPASVPQGRGHGGQGQGGQFLILESNPNGRLQISATSSSSMQHAEWMHSGTAPPAPEAAEQRKLRCTVPGCTRTFLMRPNLERHLRTAHDPGSIAGIGQ